MKTEEELLEICNKIDKLLTDSDLTFIETFGILEACKSYFVGELMARNLNPKIIAVRLKR